MTIRNILDKFEDYDIRFDCKDNILFIYKSITVSDYLYLRTCLSLLKEKIKIIVMDRRSYYLKKYYGGRL